MNPHQEAIQLRFGQWEGSRLFQWILGGNHEKRFFQGPGFTLDGDLALFHGLEQGTLGFRGGPVDLVGQQYLGEDRPGMKNETPGFLLEDRGPQDITGKHVAGELDAAEIQAQAAGQHLGQGGLADPGQVLDQQVAAGKQAGERQPDLFILAQDNLADLGHDGIELFFHSLMNNNRIGVGQPLPPDPATLTFYRRVAKKINISFNIWTSNEKQHPLHRRHPTRGHQGCPGGQSRPGNP